MKTTLGFAFLAAATLLPACATDESSKTPGDDELAGETGDGESPKADGTDNFGYMVVQRTGVYCITGGCPAYSVTRANRSTVKCANRTYQASCEFDAVAWDTNTLAADKVDGLEAALQHQADEPTIGAQVLVRGTWQTTDRTTVLVPTEVWLAQKATGDDAGTFVRLIDRNIQCITAPCPSVEEGRLNSSRSMLVSGVDFGITAKNSIEDKFENSIRTAIETPEGAIVVGDRSTTGTGHSLERYRTVGQVYLPVH